MRLFASDLGGASARRVCSFLSELASEKIDGSNDAEERSITPRCISIEGITLSVKMGMPDISGIGNDSGDIEPNRTAMM